MLTNKIQLGNLAIYAVKGQCSEDKSPHTVMVTLNARVNSVDELTHKRKYVARHGGERVGDAGGKKPLLKLLQDGKQEGSYGGPVWTHR